MICYLVRHGKDDDSVRGGWSNSPLTSIGITQAEQLALEIAQNPNMNIGQIFTSDLIRAKQTADILATALNLPVEEMSQFRETNNGVLTGMDNLLAEERYPGLYWNTLEWNQHYPGGESPCEFYHRISEAWCCFKDKIRNLHHNVILVTHGGVINVIQCIEHGLLYTNKANPHPVGNGEMVAIEITCI